MSRDIPLLAALMPNGPHHVVDLHHAGGVPAVLKELKPWLNFDVKTVDRQPLATLVEQAANRNAEVLKTRDQPIRSEGGIAVLRGNLAPEGALVKQSAVSTEDQLLRAPARVFESEEACTEAILRGEVGDGTILVIRNEGPMGGPGMREMHRITEMISRLKQAAVVTDGRFSGMSGGVAVGYVSPEACLGGPIGLVEDGDEITIDIPNRRLELHVTDDVLATRAQGYVPRPQRASGYLERYRRAVGPASGGAVIK